MTFLNSISGKRSSMAQPIQSQRATGNPRQVSPTGHEPLSLPSQLPQNPTGFVGALRSEIQLLQSATPNATTSLRLLNSWASLTRCAPWVVISWWQCKSAQYASRPIPQKQRRQFEITSGPSSSNLWTSVPEVALNQRRLQARLRIPH